MATATKIRKIVKIDEEKCTGCGDCIPNCAEGAIRIVDGVAKLVSDNLCDGIGACLGHCPEGAITIVEREAEEFDEEAVERHLGHENDHEHREINRSHSAMRDHMKAHMSGGCPGARVMNLSDAPQAAETADTARERTQSQLGHWPVKLILIPPQAPFLRGKELLLAADCVGIAHPELHNELLKGKAIAIACPKFDDADFYIERLTDIVKHSGIIGITVAHMEVPCCSGLQYIAEQAVEKAGSDLPLKNLVIGIRGEQLN